MGITAGKGIHFQRFRIIIFFLIFPYHHTGQKPVSTIIKLPFRHKKCRSVCCKIAFKRSVSEITESTVDKKTHNHLHQHTFSTAVSQRNERILSSEIERFVINFDRIIVVIQI